LFFSLFDFVLLALLFSSSVWIPYLLILNTYVHLNFIRADKASNDSITNSHFPETLLEIIILSYKSYLFFQKNIVFLFVYYYLTNFIHKSRNYFFQVFVYLWDNWSRMCVLLPNRYTPPYFLICQHKWLHEYLRGSCTAHDL
jgi:hypothetical protein